MKVTLVGFFSLKATALLISTGKVSVLGDREKLANAMQAIQNAINMGNIPKSEIKVCLSTEIVLFSDHSQPWVEIDCDTERLDQVNDIIVLLRRAGLDVVINSPITFYAAK